MWLNFFYASISGRIIIFIIFVPEVKKYATRAQRRKNYIDDFVILNTKIVNNQIVNHLLVFWYFSGEKRKIKF